MGEKSFKYSFKETRRESIGLGVYNSGLQRCEPGYRWGPAVRDHYLLHYVAGGRGEYRCPGGSWTLEAGDMFLSYPNAVISYQADRQEPWEYHWVGFQGADTRGLLQRIALTPQAPVLHSGGDSRVEELLTDIYEARGVEASGDAAMTGRLYLLLSYLMQVYPAPATASTQSRIYFEQAVRLIAQSLGQEQTVQELADRIGLSRSQLYRVFVAESGMPPVEFLNHYRVNRAAELLREQGLTVAQAAASVGYADPMYFSRVFKRIKGVPPGKYR